MGVPQISAYRPSSKGNADRGRGILYPSPTTGDLMTDPTSAVHTRWFHAAASLVLGVFAILILDRGPRLPIPQGGWGRTHVIKKCCTARATPTRISSPATID